MGEVRHINNRAAAADSAAVEVGKLYQKAKRASEDALRHYHECGVLLCETTESFAHGELLPWLKRNEKALGFGEGTAFRLKRLGKLSLATVLEHPLKASRILWYHPPEPKINALPNKKKREEHRITDAREEEIPSDEEAEESYQETVYDQACILLGEMSERTRQRFFAYIKEKYIDANNQ